MIKNLISFAINKPILNHIFLAFLFLLAIFSYQNIPKEIFPPSNLDAISITGSYPGASANVLDKMAVKTIEDDLKSLSDVSSVESTIKSNYFTIKANLKGGANKNDALSDVKDIITTAKKDFPSDMEEPRAKVIVSSFPLITVVITSDKPKEDLLILAEELKSKFSSINELSNIYIYGDADKELLFLLDEKKINAYGIDKRAVISAISSLSTIFPVGTIKERGNHLFISTQSGEKEIEKLKNTVLTINAKKVRVKDIAAIEFKLSDPDQISHFNGKPNISLGIYKSKDGNSIALSKEIKEILKGYEEKYEEYQFDTYSDTSIWIRNRLNTVISNIIFGVILVALSIYIFVSGRIAFVVGIGIPTSFMIGLIAADMLGYSLNMLSLLGALIALGMLVDEAIVVAENIYRHLEQGDEPKNAALNGALEMFPAVMTATATTIFAFLPLLILSGEMGVFIKILPIMISILLLSSLVEAFFFLPLHSKEFLRSKLQKNRGEKFWNYNKALYKKAILFLLEHKKVFLSLFLIIIIALIVVMLKNSKFQLFPNFDTTEIYITGKVNINNKIEETQELVLKVEKKLLEKLQKDEVSSVTSISGFKLDAKYLPHFAENNFQIFINLYERVPENFFDKFINPYLSPEYDDSQMKRSRSADKISEYIKEITAEFSGSKDFEEFNIIVPSAGIVESDIAIALSGDTKTVKSAIDKLQNSMKEIDGVYNINNDLAPGEKELKLRVNEYGVQLGFNEQSLANALKPYFFKAEISKMFYNDELIKIKSQEIGKDEFDTFKNFYVEIPNSIQKVRLSEIADFIYKTTYSDIFKEDGKRLRTIYGSLNKEKITSSEFLKKISQTLSEIKEKGVKVEIKGEQEENEKVQKEMGQAAIIAIFLIFLALIWMFDSIVSSLIIVSTIPLAVFGVLIGHMIMELNLTMPGMLGIVGLSGVVVNDGIIMMDFLKKAKHKEDFIQLAALRLRPILLTSITTVLGLFTLMFFASGQAIILQPMAISLGFGIAWATILNLYYVPILYALIRRI